MASACQHRFCLLERASEKVALRSVTARACASGWDRGEQRVFLRPCFLLCAWRGTTRSACCSVRGYGARYTSAPDVDEMALTDPS